MSRQLAEQNKQKEKIAAAAKSSNSNNIAQESAWWSDESEDEDEMDIRQLVAKHAAEKRKREEHEAALASERARADYKPHNDQKSNKQSVQSEESQEKRIDKTPKFCNKANADDAKSPVDLDKTTANNEACCVDTRQNVELGESKMSTSAINGSNDMKFPIESIPNDNVMQTDTHKPTVSASDQRSI